MNGLEQQALLWISGFLMGFGIRGIIHRRRYTDGRWP